MLLRRAAILLVVTLAGSMVPAQAPVLYEGRWMRKYDVEKLKYADYMRDHGYQFYFGKWRGKADVRRLQREARRQMNRLASASARNRDRARDRLHEMAEIHDMPRLVVLADRVHRDYGAYWRRRYTVTMGINFQHTELLGVDTVPVSLGVGRPVLIQLPRTRSVSIGTTVTVPAGIGR